MTCEKMVSLGEAKFCMSEEGGAGFETLLSVTGNDMDLVLNRILYNVDGYQNDDTPVVVEKLTAVLSACSNKGNDYI